MAILLPFQGAGTDVTPYPWPLRNSLELGAMPSAVPCARLHARHLLREWGLDGLGKTAELLTSELVTNAVQALAGQQAQAPVVLRLSADHARLLIEVWDAHPQMPVLNNFRTDEAPAPGAESGRGLFLVSSLSKRCGSYPTLNPAGKAVWCEIEDEQPDHGAANGSAVQAYLPRRISGAVQARPAAARHDPDVLRRLRDGLRNLDRS